MKRKGFTLVELLVVIVILGIITGLSIPLVRNISQTLENRKYTTYKDSVLEASKLYVNSYSEDLFGRKEYGCSYITYNQLSDKSLIKDIDIEKVSCATNQTVVRVIKQKDKYGYTAVIGCGKKEGSGDITNIKRYPKDTVIPINHNSCTGAADNNIAISVDEKYMGGKADKKKKTTKLKLESGTGINNHISIYTAWSLDKNGYSSINSSGWTKASFEIKGDQEKELLDGNTIKVDSNQLRTPANKTGDYYLLVRVDELKDLYGSSWSNPDAIENKYISFGPFRIDNTPPTCPTITATANNSSYTINTWTKYDIKFRFGFDSDTDNWNWYTNTGNGDYTDWGNNSKNKVEKTISGEGIRHIKLKLSDLATNTRTCEYKDDEYRIDKTNPTVTITRNTFNKFSWTASDGMSDISGYQITNSDTVPTTWTTTGTLTSGSKDNITEANTYYVWVKDGAGNTNKATIGAYQITRTQGVGTTLTTRYDSTSSSTGTAFTNNIVALNGTNIWAKTTAATGYETPTLKHGTTSMTASGSYFTVSKAEAITSGATEEGKYTVTLDRNGAQAGSTSANVKYLATSFTNEITVPVKTVTPKFINSEGATVTGGDRSGTYTFTGWYTVKNGTEENRLTSRTTTPKFKESFSGYTNASRQWIKKSNTTLYAGYDSLTLTLPTVTKVGHTCKWITNDGESERASGGSWTYTSAVERDFTASCTPNTYTVTLDRNGAQTGSTSTSVKYLGTSFTSSITVPVKTLTVTYDVGSTGATTSRSKDTKTYNFKAWYTSKTDGDRVTSSSATPAFVQSLDGYTNSSKQWIKTSNTTLYALYDSITITLPTITKSGYRCVWTTNDGASVRDSGGTWEFTSATSRTFTASCTALTKPVPKIIPVSSTTYTRGGRELKRTCTDSAGVTAYYWGTKNPTSIDDITMTDKLSSLTSSSGWVATYTAGTYYLACRNAGGAWDKTSIVVEKKSTKCNDYGEWNLPWVLQDSDSHYNGSCTYYPANNTGTTHYQAINCNDTTTWPSYSACNNVCSGNSGSSKTCCIKKTRTNNPYDCYCTGSGCGS